jgi:protein-disulfide isomerase
MRGGLKAAKARAAKRQQRSRYAFFAVIAGAVAIVGAFIALQAFGGGGGDKVPPRVATGDGRVLGSPDAPVTVIEYADFQCPVCKRAESSIISKIEQDYVLDGRVNIEFRMFPFLGQESWWAAQAAEAAREQGKFWEYHDALFNAQGREDGGSFNYENLVAIAGEVGLDVPKFEATIGQHLPALQEEADGARAAGVESTPTFFVGDKKIVGAQPYDVFVQAIEEQLAKAQAASTAGAGQ